MQEKTRGLFVAATANRIDLLPAEMIRKGRFDEVFFVDLPNEDERLDICKIHLEKRGIEPGQARHRTAEAVHAAAGPVPSSSSWWCRRSPPQARKPRADQRRPAQSDGEDRPLSKTMKEQVEHIRSWALDRAIRTAPRSRAQ
jgi:SpoVK/Ycf46/Vps4 family AAA+-type ATPase